MSQGPKSSLTSGPLIVCGFISALLTGATITQVFLYFSNFPKDARYIKGLVAIILLGELTQLSSMIALVYNIFVTHNANPGVFNTVPIPLGLVSFTSGIISAASQIMYIHRVKVVTGTPLLYLPAFAMYFIRFITMMGLGVIAISESKLLLTGILQKWYWAYPLQLASSAIGDSIVTASLAYFLIKKRRSGFERSRNSINRSALWIIETGTLTTFMSILLIIVYAELQKSWVWISLGLISPRGINSSPWVPRYYRRGQLLIPSIIVYVLSFLIPLNGRKALQDRQPNPGPGWDFMSSGSSVAPKPAVNIEMTVDIERTVDSENEPAGSSDMKMGLESQR